MDKQQIIHDYNERIAICMFDGGLSEEEAKQVAQDQLIEEYGEGVKDAFKSRG